MWNSPAAKIQLSKSLYYVFSRLAHCFWINFRRINSHWFNRDNENAYWELHLNLTSQKLFRSREYFASNLKTGRLWQLKLLFPLSYKVLLLQEWYRRPIWGIYFYLFQKTNKVFLCQRTYWTESFPASHWIDAKFWWNNNICPWLFQRYFTEVKPKYFWMTLRWLSMNHKKDHIDIYAVIHTRFTSFIRNMTKFFLKI